MWQCNLKVISLVSEVFLVLPSKEDWPNTETSAIPSHSVLLWFFEFFQMFVYFTEHHKTKLNLKHSVHILSFSEWFIDLCSSYDTHYQQHWQDCVRKKCCPFGPVIQLLARWLVWFQFTTILAGTMLDLAPSVTRRKFLKQCALSATPIRVRIHQFTKHLVVPSVHVGFYYSRGLDPFLCFCACPLALICGHTFCL